MAVVTDLSPPSPSSQQVTNRRHGDGRPAPQPPLNTAAVSLKSGGEERRTTLTWCAPDDFEAGHGIPHPRFQDSLAGKYLISLNIVVNNVTNNTFVSSTAELEGLPEGLDLCRHMSSIFSVHQLRVGHQD